MGKWKSLSIIAAAAIILTLAGSLVIEAEAATITWDAGGDGVSWSNPDNWNPNGLPLSTDTINIGNCFNCDPFAVVLLDIDFTLDPGGTIYIEPHLGGPGDPPVLVIRSDKTLTNNGLITNFGLISVEFEGAPFSTGGTIDNFGTIENFGRIFIENAGTVTNKTGSTFTNDDMGLGGAGVIEVVDGGMFENECSSTFNNFGTIIGAITKLPCRWDGEGDGLSWNDPLNWDPDGLPFSTDKIVIDDSIVTAVDVVVHLNLDFTLDPGGTISINFLGSGSGSPTLLIDSTKTLSNNGLIENSAIIENPGIIDNPGIITNLGTFDNPGTIDNPGTLDNSGTFTNAVGSSFTNESTGIINDTGLFDNLCGSTFIDLGTIFGTIVDVACFWDAGGDGTWSDPLNWGTDALPTGTNPIIIDDRSGNNPTVHLNIDFTLDSRGTISIVETGVGVGTPTLVIDSTRTLTNNGLISSPASLEGVLVENSGTLNNFGVMDIPLALTIVNQGIGAFTNESTGTINLVGGSFVNECGSTFDDFGTITGAGTISDATCHWVGRVAGGSWNDPFNWLTSVLPTRSNNIVITGPDAFVHLDIDFTLDPRATISINSGDPVSNVHLTIDDTKTLINNGAIEISGLGSFIANDGTIDNFGTISISFGEIRNTAGSTFTNESTGNIGGGQILNFCGSTFNNFGTITSIITNFPCATKLAFVIQPTDTTAGDIISPITVEAQDSLGNRDTTFNGLIVLNIGTNPSSCPFNCLSGTNGKLAVSGQATFDDLFIDEAGIGYDLLATSFGLANATSVSFNINPQTATLTVIKVVVNDDGGTKVVSDFPLFVDGGAVASGAQSTFLAGAHTVSETSDPGYAATIGGDCASDGTITLAPGDVKSCTITNDDIAPKLTVTKLVVNDDGGTKVVSEFPLFVDGGAVASGVQNTFLAGAHTVSETSDPGYTATITGDCASDGTITLAPGDVKSCTITNDDIVPKLTVTKLVVNDDGGTKVVSEFPLFVDGGAVAYGVQNTFQAGAHTVSETSDTGYTATITGNCASDGTITLAPGDVKSCTITNDDIAPKLTVTKLVVNNDGGSKVVSDFPLFVDGGPVASGAQNTFPAGAHTVSETSDPSYTATITGDCASDGTITLAPGDVKSCTITNDDIALTPQQTIESVGDDLQEIVSSNPGTPLADKTEDVLNKLQVGLDELNKTPPDNQAAVGAIEGAVGDLEAALGVDPAQDLALTDLMDRLSSIPRQLAVEAIAEAIAQGGDPVKISEAEQSLADGDTLRGLGAFKDAVNKYKDALAKAESEL